MDYIEILKKLGLSQKSADVYVALLGLGQANASQIAESAGIERTTVYKILEELSDMGLISKSTKGKRTTYVSEPPENLEHIYEEKLSLAKNIVPVLGALEGKNTVKPVVRLYESKESIRQVLTNTLESKEKLRRDFASVEDIVDFLGKRFIHQHVEKRVEKGIEVRSLRSARDKKTKKGWLLKESKGDLLREVRYLPEGTEFSDVIFVYDNTVVVISSKKESFALVVESRELAHSMKTLFDIAWASAGEN